MCLVWPARYRSLSIEDGAAVANWKGMVAGSNIDSVIDE